MADKYDDPNYVPTYKEVCMLEDKKLPMPASEKFIDDEGKVFWLTPG